MRVILGDEVDETDPDAEEVTDAVEVIVTLDDKVDDIVLEAEAVTDPDGEIDTLDEIVPVGVKLEEEDPVLDVDTLGVHDVLGEDEREANPDVETVPEEVGLTETDDEVVDEKDEVGVSVVEGDADDDTLADEDTDAEADTVTNEV